MKKTTILAKVVSYVLVVTFLLQANVNTMYALSRVIGQDKLHTGK